MKTLTTVNLKLGALGGILFEQRPYVLSGAQKVRVTAAYEFLLKFSKNKIIYGINTGFGPMAQYKISEEDLHRLQYNLIHSHSNGAGETLTDMQVRAVMVCRLHSLSLGYSGASLAVVEQLERFIEAGVYPLIFRQGSVGASGDLVQLAHVGLGLIGEGMVRHEGKVLPAGDVLRKLHLQPLELSLRDGLAIINGTSCMTGIAALNYFKAKRLLHWQVAVSCMINELISAFDDAFSEELNGTKRHRGQQDIARMMREHLSDSKLINKRESWFFTDSEDAKNKVFRKRLQEYYSIRCVPQILGPIYDIIEEAGEMVENEINSASDNPIVDIESNNVYHGGNFHGDYISFEMDKLKIAITKLSLLADRQLNFLVNPKLNDIFPPFLNQAVLGLNFGVQGLQFTACSTTAENQALSNPMYVHSIPTNNDNQDIVSMGANSALMADKVIENASTVVAVLLVSAAQAADILNKHELLSSKSRALYKAIRRICKPIDDDKPHYEELNKLKNFILSEGPF